MTKKLTLEIFIQRSRTKHGDKYDYSYAEYCGKDAKVQIICPTHGNFWQAAASHMKGIGCPNCAARARGDKQLLGLETFIKKAKEIHGEKYNYSKVKYINNTTKVIIICPKHGAWEQVPRNHLTGFGCYPCGREDCSQNHLSNTKDFIQKAIKIHKDTYDYSKSKYQAAKENIIIICKKHGQFEQTPMDHLRGCGCQICGRELCDQKRILGTTKFIEKAKQVHKNFYSYEKTDYKNTRQKVIITCHLHNDFLQTPNDHLNGYGCPGCASYKSEEVCRNVFEELFGIKFPKRQPRFLKGLELDGFNESLMLAFEYNGIQHYEYITHYHRGDLFRFEYQKERDNEKRGLCDKEGVTLITIPYMYDHKCEEELREFIYKELIDRDLL